MSALTERLGLPKGAPLRLAASDVMTASLKVLPGSVTPFALVNDVDRKVVLLLDVGLRKYKQLIIHPMVRVRSSVPPSR